MHGASVNESARLSEKPATDAHNCPANPCAAVEFPVILKGLFRPHYMMWSEQQKIEEYSPAYLRNVIRILTETGLRVYKELAPLRKDQIDLPNRVIFIADSKTPTGVAEVPLTDIAVEAFRNQIEEAGLSPWLFPSPLNPTGYQTNFRKPWETALRKAGNPYFRLCDLGSTYATRLSAGGVADDADAAANRRQSVQEVFADETGSPDQTGSQCQRETVRQGF